MRPSGCVKEIVTGIGVLNLLAVFPALFKFPESFAALTALGNGEPAIEKESVVEPISIESVPVESGTIESGPSEPASTESGSTQPIALSAEHSASQPAALSDHRATGVPPQP